MKNTKIFLFPFFCSCIICLLNGGIASGQVAKGKWQSSAVIAFDKDDINFLQSNSGEDRYYQEFNLSLQLGYFISNRIVAGLIYTGEFGKSGELQTDGDYSNSKNTSHGPGIFVQYYRPVGKKFYYSPLLAAFYERGKETGEAGNNSSGNPILAATNRYKSYSVELQPLQFSYQLTRRFLVEASIASVRYRNERQDSELQSPGPGIPPSTTKTDYLDFDLNPFISRVRISFIF